MDYNIDYYQNLLRIHTNTAKEINYKRWKLIIDNCKRKSGVPYATTPLTVLDYGCGVGWFSAFAPEDLVQVDNYDIMPVLQTGIRHTHYDIVCLWDVLEHIDWENDPDGAIEDILTKTDYVATTIPILPLGADYNSWKHNKKDEHLTRFQSLDAVIHFFNKRNFKLMKITTDECPPREDVYSFLFEKDIY